MRSGSTSIGMTKKVGNSLLQDTGVLFALPQDVIAVGTKQRTDLSCGMAMVNSELPPIGINSSTDCARVSLIGEHAMVIVNRDPVLLFNLSTVNNGRSAIEGSPPSSGVFGTLSAVVVAVVVKLSVSHRELRNRLDILASRTYSGFWIRSGALKAVICEVLLNHPGWNVLIAPAAENASVWANVMGPTALIHRFPSIATSRFNVSRTALRIASFMATCQWAASFSKVSRSALESFKRSLKLLGSIYLKNRPSIAPCQREGERIVKNYLGHLPLEGGAQCL